MLLEHKTSMLPHAIKRPYSTNPGSCHILQSLRLYLHVICFRLLSSAALSVIALRRLSHYLSPCGVVAHLCTLVWDNKKGKERQSIVPCWLTLLQFQRPFHLLQMLSCSVKMLYCIETICILIWHMKIFQGLYGQAGRFGKGIFEKLLTTNFYSLWMC